MASATIEEYLEMIYRLAVKGGPVIGARLAEAVGVSPPTVTQTLKRMVKDGYVRVSAQKEITLTPAGMEQVRSIQRRHRLAELLHEIFDEADDHPIPVFRVLDERSRQEAMRAVRGGLIIFNLNAQRIVQVHNNLLRVRRRDRGRIRSNGVPVDGHLYSYELPDDWSLVP